MKIEITVAKNPYHESVCTGMFASRYTHVIKVHTGYGSAFDKRGFLKVVGSGAWGLSGHDLDAVCMGADVPVLLQQLFEFAVGVSFTIMCDDSDYDQGLIVDFL